MILTNCPVCAAPLPDTSAKQCSRCKTRYCGPACQKQHWEQGHDKLCKKIKRGGGAEKFHADTKYAESVVVAAKACAEDTKGQTCYICLEVVHSRTGEGLVRGCACGDRDGVASGRTGVAHVSCLARQAQVLVAEAEERNLDDDAFNARWRRWDECRLCEQDYHGVVACALGWACWKTYVGRPETDELRHLAMNILGNGLFEDRHFEDALSVREAELAMKRRLGSPDEAILGVQSNLASNYEMLGRVEEALNLYRDVYSGHLKLLGEEHAHTLLAATNYADCLKNLERFEEAKSLLCKVTAVARRVLGESNELTLRMRWNYARALNNDPDATLDDVREAVTTLQDAGRTARQVLGGANPTTVDIEGALQIAQTHLSARESQSAAGRS